MTFVEMNKYHRVFILFPSFLLFFSSFHIEIFGQESQLDSPSSVNDTIKLDEVLIQQNQQAKITGALSGKITFNVEGIKNLPSIMGNTNILKMLELTPGVQTSGDGNSNLYVRGGDPGQNLLTYNGNTIYTPGHILNLFPLFNVDHLSSLELLKSGVNAQYGGFLSSAISVSTKKRLPEHNTIKGNVGLLSSQATADVRINDKFGAYLSGRFTYIDLLLKPLLKTTINKDAEEELNDMGCDFYDFNVTVIGELSKGHKLIFDGFYSKDVLSIKDDEIALDGDLNWKNIALSVGVESKLGETNLLEQTIRYTKFTNVLRTGQMEMILRLQSDIEDVGYSNRLSYYVKNIPFYSGVDYKFHNVLPQETKIRNIGFDYQTENFGKNTAHDLSFFTSSTIRLIPKLYLEPGVRFNTFTSKLERSGKSKTFSSMDFRFSSRYQVDETKFVRGSFSHNNQYINKLTPSSLGLPTDFWVASSSEISPQKGNEISFGYFQSFCDGMFELSSDVYYRNMNNVTEFNQNFIENDNVVFSDKVFYGKGRSYGLEILLKKNTGKFTGWLSYAIGKSDRKFSGINDGKVFPSKYDRTHDLSIVASYTFNKRWDTSLVYIYATGNTYTQPTSWYFMNGTPVKEYTKYNNARMPDYNRTDISVNYWFKKDNGINFSLHNMFSVNNPVYIFMVVQKDKETEELQVRIKQKKLFTIIPSINWRFKF